MAPELVAGKLGEQVSERVLTDLAEPLGSELQLAFGVVDQTRVLKLLRQLGELVEAASGVVT